MNRSAPAVGRAAERAAERAGSATGAAADRSLLTWAQRKVRGGRGAKPDGERPSARGRE